MKILLCTPIFEPINERWMPLGICYIAAVLKQQGHQVKIIDRYVLGFSNDEEAVNNIMCEDVKYFDPDIVGFSTYTPVIYDTINAVKSLRKSYKKTIILGGHHATTYPELTLKRIPEADMVIAGEGESSFAMLAGGEDKKNIPGLYWREEGQVRKSDARVIRTDLTELPLPAYELLDMDFYTTRNIYTIRSYFRSVGCMISARGCNNRCSFCTESLTFSGGICLHSTEYVIENIKMLIDKYNCDGITLYDNNFLADKSRAKSVLNAVIEEGLNKKVVYCIQARADDIDVEIAKLMKKAGFSKVEIGIESYNKEILKKVGKNISIETTEKALEICRRNGISVQANLIMGFEGETIEVLESTRQWIKKLSVDNFKWGKLQLYPGTLLYRQKASGVFEDKEWTKENVDRFFSEYNLSEIPQEQRKDWEANSLRPFRQWVHHRGLMRRNSIFVLVKYYTGKILRRWN